MVLMITIDIFYDIAINKNKTDLYYKPTHTGQCSECFMEL